MARPTPSKTKSATKKPAAAPSPAKKPLLAAPKKPVPSAAPPKAAAKPAAAKPTVVPKAAPPKAAAPKTAAPKAAAPKPPTASAAPAPSTADQQRALANMKTFFDRTLSALDEGDSTFTPSPQMFSAAQQVAHAAQTVDWFLEGAFSPKGFGMDFPAMEAEVRKVTSLAAAKAQLEQAHARLLKALRERPAAEWFAPIVKDTIMAGAPRIAIVDGLVDHTAHHRGALAVYARLRGKTPPMPYM